MTCFLSIWRWLVSLFQGALAKSATSGPLAQLSFLIETLPTDGTNSIQRRNLNWVYASPPLAGKMCPVIHLLFSDATNKTMSATSSTVPQRSAALVFSFITLPRISHWSASIFSFVSRIGSVTTPAGATVLTVIPLLFPSCKKLLLARSRCLEWQSSKEWHLSHLSGPKPC